MSQGKKGGGAHNQKSVQPIVISRQIFEDSNGNDYDLPLAIVEYVNQMNDIGLYDRNDMPRNATQAYHLDLYLCEVNNGGHSQFIHNVGNKLAMVCKDARKALVQMRAFEHLKMLDAMADWVKKNPTEALAQTGFDGGIAAYMKELDELFFKQQRVKGLNELSTQWIRNWPELTLVDDPKSKITELALANPNRERRLNFQEISKINHWIADPLRSRIGLTLTSATSPEFPLKIFPGQFKQAQGTVAPTWTVLTTSGNRIAVVNDDETCIFERIDAGNIPFPRFETINAVLKAIKAKLVGPYMPPVQGRCINRVSGKVTTKYMQEASDCKLATAIQLLLKKANISTQCQSVALTIPIAEKMPGGNVAAALVVHDKVYYAYITNEHGHLLNKTSGKIKATVKLTDIQNHHECNQW